MCGLTPSEMSPTTDCRENDYQHCGPENAGPERCGDVEGGKIARHRNWHGPAHRKGGCLKEHAAARDAARASNVGMRVEMGPPVGV